MKRTLLAIALAGLGSAPAFAMDMSCADFSALDGGAQASMVATMAQSPDDAAGSMMAGAPADDDAAGSMMAEAPANDDALGSMMADDAAASMADGGDDLMMNDQMTADLANTCADHPEMMLDDAMQGTMAPE